MSSQDLLRPFLERHQTLTFVGMMGSGKSSVGSRAAKVLGLSFFDSDREVEKAANCSLCDIYALWGQEAFQSVEKEVVSRLLEASPHVLSTGDSTFLRPELRGRMLKETVVVWLKAGVETLYKRVRRRNTRPQLLGKNTFEVLEKLIEERSDIYAQAHLVVESRDEAHDLTMKRVLEALIAYVNNMAKTV